MGKNIGFIEVAKSCIALLTAKEKEVFQMYIRAEFPPASQAKYLELFAGLQRAQLPPSLVPKYFKNSRAVEDGCRQLRTKLIRFIGAFRNIDTLEFALSHGFVRFAAQQLKEEHLAAQARQDIYRIGHLLALGWKYKFGIDDERLPQTKEEATAIQIEKANLAKAEYFFAKANEHINASIGHIMTEERKKLFAEGKDEVIALDQAHFFPYTRARILYAQAIWFLLVRDYPTVQPLLRERLEIMRQFPDLFSTMEIFTTASTLFKTYLSGQHFDKTRELLYEMGGLEAPETIKSEAILMTWYFFSLTQAACGGDMDLGRVALRTFKNMPPIPDKITMENAVLAAALVAVYDQKWELAEKILKTIPSPNSPIVLIKAGALGILIPYEMGEVALARRRAYKYFNTLKKFEGLFGAKTIALLEEKILFWCSSGFGATDIQEEAIATMERLEEFSKQEKQQGVIVNQFELILWIKSKALDLGILEAIERKAMLPMLSMVVPD